MTKISKKLGVMKPSMWLTFHGITSYLVATTYVNITTALQNAQKPKKH